MSKKEQFGVNFACWMSGNVSNWINIYRQCRKLNDSAAKLSIGHRSQLDNHLIEKILNLPQLDHNAIGSPNNQPVGTVKPHQSAQTMQLVYQYRRHLGAKVVFHFPFIDCLIELSRLLEVKLLHVPVYMTLDEIAVQGGVRYFCHQLLQLAN